MPRRADTLAFGKLDLAVDSSRHIALYVQLAGIFRHKVVSRAWAAGQRLPNFETLADQFKVARITVRQAVAAGRAVFSASANPKQHFLKKEQGLI